MLTEKEFTRFYKETNETMIRWVINRSDIPIEDAENLLAEAYSKVWENRETIADFGKALKFIYITLRNDMSDFFRHDKRVKVAAKNILRTSETTTLLPSDKEQMELIQSYLQVLTPQRRKVFELLLEGNSNVEIAAKMGLSPNTIGVFIKKGIESVRASFNIKPKEVTGDFCKRGHHLIEGGIYTYSDGAIKCVKCRRLRENRKYLIRKYEKLSTAS